MSRARLAVVVLLLAFTLGQGTARAETPSSNRLSALAGWWNAELEFETSFGLYAAAGAAWGATVYNHLHDRVPPRVDTIPFEAALGYRHHLNDRLSLAGGAHALRPIRLPGEPSCVGSCTGVWGWMLEVGLRYQWPSGLVVGVNAPIFGMAGDGDVATLLYPPFSLAVSQVYAGWTWEF